MADWVWDLKFRLSLFLFTKARSKQHGFGGCMGHQRMSPQCASLHSFPCFISLMLSSQFSHWNARHNSFSLILCAEGENPTKMQDRVVFRCSHSHFSHRRDVGAMREIRLVILGYWQQCGHSKGSLVLAKPLQRSRLKVPAGTRCCWLQSVSTGVPVQASLWSPWSLHAHGGEEMDLCIEVEWFVRKTKFVCHCCRFALYKLPKHTNGDGTGLGLEYLYMDSLAQQWQPGRYLVNMTQSALGQTLGQLYKAYESKVSKV